MVNSEYEKAYRDAAENYHVLHPKITVTIDYPTEPSLERADLTKLLGNEDSPDIVQLDLNYLGIAEEKDLLVDLKQSFDVICLHYCFFSGIQ